MKDQSRAWKSPGSLLWLYHQGKTSRAGLHKWSWMAALERALTYRLKKVKLS